MAGQEGAPPPAQAGAPLAEAKKAESWFKRPPPRWWLAVLALLLLLVSTSYEIYSHANESAHAGESAGAHADEGHSFTSWMLSLTVWAALLREIGFALTISFVIGWLIEQDSWRRQEAFVEEFSNRVSRDVFASVLGKFLPVEFQEAFLNVGRSHVIRSNMVIRYELSEFDEAEARAIPSLREDFIKLHIFTDYTLKNISGSTYTHKIVNAYPVRSESAFHRDCSHMARICIGKQELSREEINALITEADEDRQDYSKFEKEYVLQRGEELQITYENVLVKERSDNEVWVSLIPTDRLWIHCDAGHLETPVTFGVTAHFPSGMDERLKPDGEHGRARDANGGVWASRGPVLPYQSVVFWWRERMPETVNAEWKRKAPPVTPKAPPVASAGDKT